MVLIALHIIVGLGGSQFRTVLVGMVRIFRTGTPFGTENTMKHIC